MIGKHFVGFSGINVSLVVIVFTVLAGVSQGWLVHHTVQRAPSNFQRHKTPLFMVPLRTTSNNVLQPLYFRTSESDRVDKMTTVLEDDEYDEDDEESDNEDDEEVYDSQALRILSKTIIPLSASIGFAVAPTGRLAFRLGGAAAGGLVGLAAKSAIRTYARKPDLSLNDGRFSDTGGSGVPASVSVTIDQLYHSVGSWTELTTLTIEAAAKNNRVREEHLSLLFTMIFSEAVYEATDSSSMDLTELIDLIRFAETLQLSEAEVGDGLALAATRLGKSLAKDERGFYEDDYSEQVLNQAAKMLFLADKMVGVEGGYYGRRMLPALSYFTLETYRDAVTDACKQLFRRCVEGVLVDPQNYQSGEVEDLKQFLTVSPTVSDLRPAIMQHMILEAIQFMLNRTLPVTTSPMEATVRNYDTFLQAQPILGWERREWLNTLAARTLPLFETALKDLFRQVSDQPGRASELAVVLQERLDALHVDPAKARVLVSTLISERNAEYMNRIDRVHKASGGEVGPAYKTMLAYAHTHQALCTLTEPVMRGARLPLPGLPFPDMVRASMFQAQLSKGGAEDKGGVHADMFALTPEQQQAVRRHLALPKLISWVKQCLAEGNTKPEARAAYEKLLAQNNVTQAEWAATATDFYYQEVLKVSRARAVPTQEDMTRLAAVSGFLGCPEEAVAKVHLELLGDKYVKALTESMTPTGVITEEYVDGLRRLRQRLGLLDKDADVLFGVAARTRLGPIIKDLVDIWKSDTDANYRRDKERNATASGAAGTDKRRDKSGDPIDSPDNVFGYMEENQAGQKKKDGTGPGVFMREVLNLVDFLSENHKLLDSDIADLSNLQVTAGGIVTTDDIAGVFKHFLVTALMETEPVLSRRCREVEPLFARVLGIPPEGQAKIKKSLAYTLSKNVLMGALRRQDSVDTRTTTQLAQVCGKLGVDSKEVEVVVSEATRGAMAEHVAQVIRATAEGAPMTAESVRRLRTQVESLGLDWRADLRFSDILIGYFYALEVQAAVEAGAEESLSELQAAYDIPVERAVEIVEAVCKRTISQLLNLALRGAKKYDERDAVHWLKRILRFVPYVSSSVEADGNLFSEKDKRRLIAFYQAEVEGGEDTELAELGERIGNTPQRLQTLINLTESFVAPVQGIEGLLGNVKSLSQLGAELNADAGRKAWAWG